MCVQHQTCVRKCRTKCRDTTRPPDLSERSVSRLTFNNMPVASFINEVFSNQLKLDYILNQA